MSLSPKAPRRSNRRADRTGLGGGPPAPTVLDRELVELDREQRSTIDILIVDDEHSLRESCASLLKTEGFNITVEGDGEDAVRLVKNRRFDILLLDLYMTPIPGLEIMEAALDAHPDSLVIVMTGNPSVETSVKALRQGAWDYLPKPFSATHFQVLVGRAAHAVMVGRESESSVGTTVVAEEGERPSSRSPAFAKVLDVARHVARTDASVFITGESGAGKEIIARYIHEQSRRRSRPLIPVNCAAIPEALLESEMFGHVEGAFTGAVRDKQGLLEVANGGTLFLDELTELPLPTQAKLLRVLQDGVVRRVGSVTTDAVVNVRFIAATNRNPQEAIKEGTLRKDLHYRLRVVPIHVPPLRERQEDIPAMARDFLDEFWQAHRDPGAPQPTFSDGAIRSFQRAAWPGNVREMRNVIEHLVVLAEEGSTIEPDDIPYLDDGGELDPFASGSPFASVMSLGYHEAREKVLTEFETQYLRHVVDTAEGNISDAARIAGVDRTTLYRLMEKHGTQPHRGSGAQDGDG
ncbi:MAG: sigma-54 dependent transcriptional regulator [Longimicrobiales bacterium]